MSGAPNTRRQARWGLFTDAELQLIADTLRTTAQPAAYLAAMYGEDLAPAIAQQIARELAARGYNAPRRGVR